METRFAPAAHTGAISDAFPLDPPVSWFHEIPEGWTPGEKLTIWTDGPNAGRIAATVAPRGQCLLDGTGECWQPQDSPTRYEAAMQGTTVTAEGHVVHTANIGGGVNHAGPTAPFRAAVDHYANTASALMRVAYYDLPDNGGTIALGAAWPGITDRDVRTIQAMALSGDWRYRPELGAYDMAGSQLVNVPGLPLMSRPNAHPLSLAFAPTAMAASLSDPHPAIVGGWTPQEAPMGTEPTLTLTLTASEAARLHAILAASVTAAAAPCACGGHTAATPPASAPAVAPEAIPGPTAEDFAALVARVDALEQAMTESDLAGLDGQMAALSEKVAAAAN